MIKRFIALLIMLSLVLTGCTTHTVDADKLYLKVSPTTGVQIGPNKPTFCMYNKLDNLIYCQAGINDTRLLGTWFATNGHIAKFQYDDDGYLMMITKTGNFRLFPLSATFFYVVIDGKYYKLSAKILGDNLIMTINGDSTTYQRYAIGTQI